MTRAIFCLAALSAMPVFAATVTFDTIDRGWIRSDGVSNGSRSYNSYYVGVDASFNDGLELRNWFTFDVSSLTQMVFSAYLQIATGTVKLPDGVTSETYQLTSIPGSFGYSDLGTGTVYGTQTYTASDSDPGNTNTLLIALDPSSFLSIQSGDTFSLGGRLTTLTQNAVDEAVFASISGDPASVELIVNTVEPVPEPASIALFVSGLGVVAWRRRTRASQR